MQMERKSYKAQIKAIDEAQGLLEAVVAVFSNVDEGGDRILPGAFAKSIADRMPMGVWSHDWTQPIAKTLMAKELLPGDPSLPKEIANLGGLYVKGQINLSTQRGKEAFSDIQFGIISEFSIGYWPTKVTYINDKEDEAFRELVEVDLLEWSPVLAGMNPLTQLVSAKGKANDARTLSEDLALLIDGTRVQAAESERILARVEKRRELLTTKQGRELSAQNEAMLEAAASDMVTHAGNISGLLSRVRGEASRTPSFLKVMRTAYTKQLPMTPEVSAIIEAIDTLLDALLGEPEEDEPKGISAADIMTMQLNLRKARLALVR